MNSKVSDFSFSIYRRSILTLHLVYLQGLGDESQGRLKHLVPSIGRFFTKLPLERAFYVQDEKRSISARRLVSPSFNDIRLILNTAQTMSLVGGREPLKLVTFDGDVTLYEDGMSLTPENPIVERLLFLLQNNIYVGIVTAAGYSEISGEKYEVRLKGLIDAVNDSEILTQTQKESLLVMGGESNFLFRFDSSTGHLKWIDPQEWTLPEIAHWSEEDIQEVLNIGQAVLENEKNKLNLPATILRKERGVGIIPLPGKKICRESLEEIVLTAQRKLETSAVGKKIHFCAFNGGADVWVDIGDKRLGVLSLQKYLNDINGFQTLHVGDQFASVGANDFKARLAACTVWIASPAETVDIIDELLAYLIEANMYSRVRKVSVIGDV